MYINYKAGFTMFVNIDFNTLEVNSTVLKALLHFEGGQIQF